MINHSVERDPVVDDEMEAIRSALVTAYAERPGDDRPDELTELVNRLRGALADRLEPLR